MKPITKALSIQLGKSLFQEAAKWGDKEKTKICLPEVEKARIFKGDERELYMHRERNETILKSNKGR